MQRRSDPQYVVLGHRRFYRGQICAVICFNDEAAAFAFEARAVAARPRSAPAVTLTKAHCRESGRRAQKPLIRGLYNCNECKGVSSLCAKGQSSKSRTLPLRLVAGVIHLMCASKKGVFSDHIIVQRADAFLQHENRLVPHSSTIREAMRDGGALADGRQLEGIVEIDGNFLWRQRGRRLQEAGQRTARMLS